MNRSLLNLKLGWPVRLWGLLVPALLLLGLTDVSCAPVFYLGAGDLDLGPCSNTVGTLPTNAVISLTPKILFLNLGGGADKMAKLIIAKQNLIFN